MFVKSIAAGLAASALLCHRCVRAKDHAQPPTAPTWRRRRHRVLLPGRLARSKVVGLNVYNDNNESVGSINDLLMDKSGNIKAAVISVGGFLGVGAHLVAVPFDKIKFVNEPVAYTGVAGARRTPGNRPPSTTTTGLRPPAVAGDDAVEAQSLVSGSRRVQRDQGRTEGDAGVQIFDMSSQSLSLRSQRPEGRAARSFAGRASAFGAHGAPHPFGADIPMLGLLAAGAPASCLTPNGRTIWLRASTRSSS